MTLLALPGQTTQFSIAHLEGTRAVPFALFGSPLRLLLSQTVEVADDKCHTVTYAYRVATGAAKPNWLLRWEYFRDPPRPDYVYTLAHAHLNGRLLDPGAEERLTKPVAHLHVPTARVPLELVLWHLIAEWEVEPRTSDWQQILRDSIAGFERRRTAY